MFQWWTGCIMLDEIHVCKSEIFLCDAFALWKPCLESQKLWRWGSVGLCDKFLPRVRCLDLAKKWNQNCRTGAAEEEESTQQRRKVFFPDPSCISSAPNYTLSHLNDQCSVVCCEVHLLCSLLVIAMTLAVEASAPKSPSHRPSSSSF